MGLKFGDFDYAASSDQFLPEQREISDVRLLVVDAKTGAFNVDSMANLGQYLRDTDYLTYNDVGIGPSILSGRLPDCAEFKLCLLRQIDRGPRWEAVVLSEQSPPTVGEFQLADGAITGRFVCQTDPFDAAFWLERDRYKGYRGVVHIDQATHELSTVLSGQGTLMHPWYINLNDLDPHLLNPPYVRKRAAVLISEPARRISEAMRAAFRKRGIQEIYFSLSMAFGWRPSSADTDLDGFKMNLEEFEVDDQATRKLLQAAAQRHRVIAVGTSGVRAIESLEVPCRPKLGLTDIFIAPGYAFKHCSGLLTNLHAPKGTHVIMASAFAGRELVMDACSYAVSERMRFGVQGDTMLVFSSEEPLSWKLAP